MASLVGVFDGGCVVDDDEGSDDNGDDDDSSLLSDGEASSASPTLVVEVATDTALEVKHDPSDDEADRVSDMRDDRATRCAVRS